MDLKEYKYRINGIDFNVKVGDMEHDTVHVEVNGIPYNVELRTEKKKSVSGKMKRPAQAPRTESGEKVISTPTPQTGSPDAIKAPLPGTITAINVKVGDSVAVGDTVCVLEAMKMENSIHTNKAGTITKILVNTGDAVLEGSDLMIIG